MRTINAQGIKGILAIVILLAAFVAGLLAPTFAAAATAVPVVSVTKVEQETNGDAAITVRHSGLLWASALYLVDADTNQIVAEGAAGKEDGATVLKAPSQSISSGKYYVRAYGPIGRHAVTPVANSKPFTLKGHKLECRLDATDFVPEGQTAMITWNVPGAKHVTLTVPGKGNFEVGPRGGMASAPIANNTSFSLIATDSDGRGAVCHAVTRIRQDRAQINLPILGASVGLVAMNLPYRTEIVLVNAKKNEVFAPMSMLVGQGGNISPTLPLSIKDRLTSDMHPMLQPGTYFLRARDWYSHDVYAESQRFSVVDPKRVTEVSDDGETTVRLTNQTKAKRLYVGEGARFVISYKATNVPEGATARVGLISQKTREIIRFEGTSCMRVKNGTNSCRVSLDNKGSLKNLTAGTYDVFVEVLPASSGVNGSAIAGQSKIGMLTLVAREGEQNVSAKLVAPRIGSKVSITSQPVYFTVRDAKTYSLVLLKNDEEYKVLVENAPIEHPEMAKQYVLWKPIDNGIGANEIAAGKVFRLKVIATSPDGDSHSDTSGMSGEFAFENTSRPTSNSYITVAPKSISSRLFTQSDPSATYGQFIVSVDVTARGGDIYIPKTAAGVGLSNADTAGALFNQHVGNTFQGSASGVLTSTGDTVGGMLLVKNGETETITLRVNLNPSVTGGYGAGLDRIRFSSTPGGTLQTLDVDEKGKGYKPENLTIKDGASPAGVVNGVTASETDSLIATLDVLESALDNLEATLIQSLR